MDRMVRFFTVILFGVFCVGVTAIAEEITLTTYYPAPYGNYEELQATTLAVGSGTTMPATDGDIEAAGTIRANTAFNLNGTDGDTGTYTVVTDVRILGINLQIKSRTITVTGGIITDIGAETAWTNVGTV
jgi:hypothetical protein